MFGIFKPKLMQFGDGKFALRKLTLAGYCYMDKDGYWWISRKPKYDNEEEAINAYLATVQKVISTLDDEWDL
jgi:hypothetical protein